MYKHWQPIEGVPGAFSRNLGSHHDDRGSLTEFWRVDEMDDLRGLGKWPMEPMMGYLSWTRTGQARGPHEHEEQTDLFIFVGPGVFNVYLWDNTGETPGKCVVIQAGESLPKAIVVPPGIVHGYRCRYGGDQGGMVVNLPNALYQGKGKKDQIDEIRHEDNPDSPFMIPRVVSSVHTPWPETLPAPYLGMDITEAATSKLVGRVIEVDGNAVSIEIYDNEAYNKMRDGGNLGISMSSKIARED